MWSNPMHPLQRVCVLPDVSRRPEQEDRNVGGPSEGKVGSRAGWWARFSTHSRLVNGALGIATWMWGRSFPYVPGILGNWSNPTTITLRLTV